MIMNQYEIERAHSNQHACHNVRKGVHLLYCLVHAVNQQSDGWPYWRAPSHAAEKLMELLATAGNLAYDTHGKISDADLKKAITPIKAMVTRQKKVQARYGNKPFEFDVEAVLRETDEDFRICPAGHRFSIDDPKSFIKDGEPGTRRCPTCGELTV